MREEGGGGWGCGGGGGGLGGGGGGGQYTGHPIIQTKSYSIFLLY